MQLIHKLDVLEHGFLLPHFGSASTDCSARASSCNLSKQCTKLSVRQSSRSRSSFLFYSAIFMYGWTWFQWNVTHGQIKRRRQMSDKIMCKVEYLNEQWSWKELVHHLLIFNDQPAYVVEGGNKSLIHSRPQINICQNPHLIAL